ncbi:GNAT family N-acetyltransferase [Marinisporobacter balticus]|uniref:RimJ/RimL family protein N-acetyltransferase n=1 Tax=Marinisporobacter balticus TaxID=2018667 RepID=A0A4R2KY15_9FIRM|nr:GNAT family N-acetyltransferase [Marinisporobacter balticus]TCO77982.1 RimJ/RimL family protein N-acetyltransferase [Marinisporobacter balticus]
MNIRGEKVSIRKLIREDVDKMQCWSMHEDPLYFHYDFPKLNHGQRDEWFKIKTKKFRKKCFAIENDKSEVVGYICIRNIRWIKRESELGIVLDAKHMNQGYGTEAILLFLDYYFNKLKMKSILLRTAKYNKRAIRCYTRCGFIAIKESLDEFEDQYAEIFYNPLYNHLKGMFTITDEIRKTDYIHMIVKKDEFYKKINHVPTKLFVSAK